MTNESARREMVASPRFNDSDDELADVLFGSKTDALLYAGIFCAFAGTCNLCGICTRRIA